MRALREELSVQGAEFHDDVVEKRPDNDLLHDWNQQEWKAAEPRIAEIDINPLLASPDGIIALDARIVLHPNSVPDHDLPRPDRKSTRLNSSHIPLSRMPSSA